MTADLPAEQHTTQLTTQPFGTLYVVATPIGNLDDLSPRARDVLSRVDLVAAEDTRHAKKLFHHAGVKTPLIAYHDHNETERCDDLIEKLKSGKQIALISDAGTPLISDPGYRLTQAAHQHDIPTVPVVGACAAIAALSVAGLPSDRFSFEGFLPNKQSQRKIKLNELVSHTQTLIFYESPHRIKACLADMVASFGEARMACLCRELTKTFETVKQGSLSELLDFVSADSNQEKGEIVLVVSGATPNKDSASTQADELILRLLDDLSVKKTAQLASELTGIKKNTLYQRALALQKTKENTDT